MRESNAASFTGLVDLAADSLGGRTLWVSDDFFAEAANMLQDGRAEFVPGKFTDRGKWMDGWESRRKRATGHDACIVQLGAPGEVLGFDIDTQHFVGNHPPFASVEGLMAPLDAPADALAAMAWRELLPQSPLRPDSQNLFAASRAAPVSHLRLNIYPDGGVARFRAYGRVAAGFAAEPRDLPTREHVAPELNDLAAVKSGALALACSDAFFGPMNNLLMPGRASNMGGGWETRRKRAPGHDWILIKLAERGMVQVIEVDTNHFKGNYPDRCSIEGIDAPDAKITELMASGAFHALLPEQRLQADTRHFFSDVLEPHPAMTHVRLNIYPDGGISRLRLWGTRHG